MVTITKTKAALVSREASITPESWDDKTSSVEICLSAGAKVRRSSFWTGEVWDEELVISREAIRAERLDAGPSLIDSHYGYSVRDVLGRILPGTWSIRDGKLFARLAFSVDPAHAGTVANVRAGILDKISIGYRTWRQEVDKTTNPPVRRAVDWEVYEASLVPINADVAGVVRAGGQVLDARGQGLEAYECELVDGQRSGGDDMKLNGLDGAGGSSQGSDAAAAGTTGNRTGGAQPATGASPAAKSDPAPDAAALRAAAQAEMQRQAGITDLATRLGLSEAPELTGWRQDVGMSLDTVKARMSDVLAARSDATSPKPGGASAGRASVLVDERDKLRSAAESALEFRSAADKAGLKLVDGARELVGMSLLRFAEEIVSHEAGRRISSRDEILRRAFMSTSDFPNILGNVFSKTLRQQYEEAEKSTDGWVRETTVPDFKTVSRTQLSAAPQLLKVVQSGAVQSASMGETAEGYRIYTWAINLPINRETIINDDLDAFSRIPALLGAAARRTEQDLVYGVVTDNAALTQDSVALFHATHANLITPALALASLGTARAAMRKQVGQKNEKLNIRPKTLIVPAALETTAWQLVMGEIVAVAASSTNPFKGQFALRVDARLDDNSATAWYLVCAPAQCDTIELARLEGANGPQITQEVHNHVLGITIQVVHDVGAKAIDFRGMLKSSGTT